uniref:hypothetical protein n=1 Tax=Clostridium sp. E02 TaxID=2487134 RepID=UPI0019D187C1
VVEFIDSPPIDVKKVEVNFFDLMSLLSQIHRKKSTHSLWSVYCCPDRIVTIARLVWNLYFE